MKIKIYNDRPDYIGGSKYYLRFKKIMLQHEIEVKIHTLPPALIFIGKIDIFIWRWTRISLLSYFRLLFILTSEQRVIYGSNFFVSKALRKKLNLRVICWFPDFQVHDLPEYFNARQIKRRVNFEKMTFQNCDMIVVQNANDQRRMKNLVQNMPVSTLSFYEPRSNNKLLDGEMRMYERKMNPFILVIAQGWAHKRIDKVLKAYEKSAKQIGLVIIGRLIDQRDKEYTRSLQAQLIKTDAEILGFVTEDEKVKLLKNCTAVLNFSIYEGWNSSIEEALTFEVPLILSDTYFHSDQVPDAMFIKDESELEDIFSGNTKIRDSIDYAANHLRRLATVKEFIHVLRSL